jgi:hypothetical protein
MWHGYVERHELSGAGRKQDGAATRTTREPEVVLHTADEVAEWMERTRSVLAKDADEDAQRKNGLLTAPDKTRRGVARQDRSVYATVHATRDEVWDVCAEKVSP